MQPTLDAVTQPQPFAGAAAVDADFHSRGGHRGVRGGGRGGGYNRGAARGGPRPMMSGAPSMPMHPGAWEYYGAGGVMLVPPPYAVMGMVPGPDGQQAVVPAFTQFDETSPEFCRALAKVAKPRPPWCVGSEPTSDINEEIGRLEVFLQPTAKDKQEARDVWEAVKNATNEIAPAASMQYTGSYSWGFFPYHGRLAIAATGTPNLRDSRALLERALFKNGCKVTGEVEDGDKCVCGLMVEHAETRRQVLIRVGDSAAAAVETVRGIRNAGMQAEVRQALNCLIVLLRQSKIVDDADPAALTDEAVAVMVMAMANSYPERPTSDRVLIDFFLTYGFAAHFDTERLAVHVGGMVHPLAKRNAAHPLEIVDPANPTRNLAASVTASKLQFMRSTFNYCYHVVSEFRKETDPHNRRGQSPLSTMVGGEPFWLRVVEMAALHVEPYHDFVASHTLRAQAEAAKAEQRRLMGNARPKRGGSGGARR